jgi:hypothetical protein
MKTPLNRDTRLDEQDAQQFERMLASSSWQIYETRLKIEYARIAVRCAEEPNLVELRRAQGAAAALQAALAMPGRILADLKKKPAQTKSA